MKYEILPVILDEKILTQLGVYQQMKDDVDEWVRNNIGLPAHLNGELIKNQHNH